MSIFLLVDHRGSVWLSANAKSERIRGERERRLLAPLVLLSIRCCEREIKYFPLSLFLCLFVK